MGKYIHLFEAVSAFTEQYNGEGYDEPWVSYVKEEGKERVDYNKAEEGYILTWAGVDSLGTIPMRDSVNHPFPCVIPADAQATGFIIPTDYTDLANGFLPNKEDITEVRAGSSWEDGATVYPTVVFVDGQPIDWLSFSVDEVPAGPVTIFLKAATGYNWKSDGTVVYYK